MRGATIQRAWTNIRRWLVGRRRTAIVLGLLVILLALHPFLLRLAALPLTASGVSACGSSSASEFFCIHGGELGVDGSDAFDRAANWHGQSAGRKILLLLPRTSRIVEIGAVRSFEETCRSELAKRGIPPADIESIDAHAYSSWDEARGLSAWLKQHPEATVRLECSLFASGRLRYTFDKVLGRDDGQRVRFELSVNPACREDSWWRTRTGVKDFMYAWLQLLYAWCQGRENGDSPHLPERPGGCCAQMGTVPVFPPDAATFQREIRASIGEAPP